VLCTYRLADGAELLPLGGGDFVIIIRFNDVDGPGIALGDPPFKA
jgi:hypothetical protein